MSIIKKLRWKDKSGKTTDYDLGAKASNVEQDSTHRFVSDTEKQTWNGKANPGDIPSGSAANYGVANNDTTNRSDQLVTAQVAYQHGKEIDQLISELIWKDLGIVSGTTKASLPSEFRELWITIAPISTSITRYTLFVIRDNLIETPRRYRTGYGARSDDMWGIGVMISQTEAYVENISSVDTEYTDTAKMHIFYR